MAKLDLNQAINTLANVGVIAGIIFLAFEIQQNTEMLRVQVQSNLQSARIQGNASIMENPWLPEIFAKVRANEPLSVSEEIRLQAYHQVIFSLLQLMYENYTELQIEPPAERARAIFRGETLTPGVADTWETYRSTVPPEFAKWMEENVVDER